MDFYAKAARYIARDISFLEPREIASVLHSYALARVENPRLVR